MKKISDKELKAIQINLLSQFHNLCIDKGWTYSLCGGSLLGAVRHKGFIPWDDDIDVFMPRPDYDSFCAYCTQNETVFKLISTDTTAGYFDISSKIIDRNTILIDENSNIDQENTGVFIDLFPIDGLGDSEEAAIKEFHATSINRELLVASFWPRFFRSKSRAWYYEIIRFSFFIFSRFVNKEKLVKKINQRLRSKPFNSSRYCACVCGSYREKEIMNQEIFLNVELFDFENRKFYGLCQYDKYLTNIYGDYMKLPPKEKQITHHSFAAFWKD